MGKRGAIALRTWLRRRLLLVLLGLACAGPLAAQPADTVITGAVPLAVFEEARAVAVDPMGGLYVVDAGQHVVLRMTPLGTVTETLGGLGTSEGAFDTPMDVDPTNGLVLVVADAGNGRLQRFSRQLRFLEAVPVGEVDGGAYRSREAARFTDTSGRPIAVATSPTNELFAIDELSGLVLKWDRDRRYERVIGGEDAGAGLLLDPVSLAADATTLYVADRALQGVVVFDLFGTYLRTLAEGRAEDVQAVFRAGAYLWVVLPERLLVYHESGRLERVLDVELPAPLIDAAVVRDRLYLLTENRLWMAGW